MWAILELLIAFIFVTQVLIPFVANSNTLPYWWLFKRTKTRKADELVNSQGRLQDLEKQIGETAEEVNAEIADLENILNKKNKKR